MEITKEEFEDFKKRLHFHNKGEGVKDHCTANPIFLVEKLDRVYGIDPSYDVEDSIIRQDDSTWNSIEEVIDSMDDEDLNDILKITSFPTKEEFLATDEWSQMDILERHGYEQIYYIEQWIYVNSHFTKEAAEAFIKRKKHDYMELRIMIDSQYWSWEWNSIIDGILSGKIGLID